MHSLRWELYDTEKEGLIKIQFPVSVPHPKGGGVGWNCVKDHIIDKKEDY